MARLYQAPKPDDLISHQLDSMTLIFQKVSGITHIVADPVPAILESMGGAKVSAAIVAQKLSETYALDQGVDVEKVILARLEELCSLGLVERIAD